MLAEYRSYLQVEGILSSKLLGIIVMFSEIKTSFVPTSRMS